MKKILSLFFIFIFILNGFTFSDENLDLEDLENYSFSEVSSNPSTEPQTYSKNIISIDRKTLSVLY